MPTYPFQYSELKDAINTRLHNKIGLVANVRTAINGAVNEASDKFRSTKRKAALVPNLFEDIYQYAMPSDIEAENIIGIQPQSGNRDRNQIWERVAEEEFDVRKQSDYNLISVAQNTFMPTLLVSMRNQELRQLSIAGIEGTSAGAGTWTAFGDALNLLTDSFNKIRGSGSLQYDINSGGTTAGIQCANLSTFDLTQFKSAGSVFVWAYINTVANITNFKLRLGNNASNYYEMTATTPNDGTAFLAGWNLLRFDFNSKTTVGSPVDSTCAYAVIYMTKTAGKAADTGYRFNWLNAKQGQISNIIYYSTYLWQGVDGTFKTKSTLDTDYLIADHDEFPIILEKCVHRLGQAAREYTDAKDAAQSYQDQLVAYKRQWPTETLSISQTYYYLNSRGNNGNPNFYIR